MSRRRPTRVIALAATKGGVGKTTLASALAVRAAQESDRVALIDADDGQGSLIRWWHLRGRPSNPKLLEVPCTWEGLELVIAEGWEWVFIDTPPALIDAIEQAVATANLVVIPVRPSAVDLLAIDQIQEICKALERPFAFVLNQVEPKSPLSLSAAKELRETGDLVEAPISYRRAYIAAMTDGKSGPEVERSSACTNEIEALWAGIKARVNKSVRAR